MHVREANGQYGVITDWKLHPGTQTMYNLEVAQDHTFTVGDEQWVVHNCGGEGDSNPLTDAQYTDKVYGQRGKPEKDFHSFPDIVDNYGADGEVTSITGGDGVVRTRLQIQGWYMGREGVFDYIIEPDGVTIMVPRNRTGG